MNETAGNWLELSVEANAESVEAVSEIMARYGYNQGVVIEEPIRQDDDGDNVSIDPIRPIMVRTYLHVDDSLANRRLGLEKELWHLQQIGGVGQLTTAEREEEDWANAWKEHFPVWRIGRHFVVRPRWREFEPGPGDKVIHLDPGMAFGTGMHPSTEMCLHFMEEMDLTGADVLDAGAGSGILSIAAVLSGARRVVAVEIDPVAARSLAENIALNGMTDRISIIVGDAGQALPPDEQFPAVFANIIARILADNASVISARVAPGGCLIASGIIEEREAMVIDAYAKAGLKAAGRKQGGDWVALRFEHA